MIFDKQIVMALKNVLRHGLVPLLWIHSPTYQGTPRELKNLRWRWFIGLMFVPLVGTIQALVPLCFHNLNQALLQHASFTLVLLVATYGVILVIDKALAHIKEWIFCPVVGRAIRSLSAHLFTFVMQQPQTPTAGQLVSMNRRISRSVYLFMSTILFKLLPLLIQAVGAVIVLSQHCALHYAVILIVWILITIAYCLWSGQYYGHYRRTANIAADASASKLADFIVNQDAIQQNWSQAVYDYDQTLIKEELHANKAYIRYQAIAILEGCIVGAGVVALLSVAAYEICTHQLPASTFVLIHGYVIAFTRPLRLLTLEFRHFIEALADMINAHPSSCAFYRQSALPSQTPEISKFELHCANVTYTIPGQSTPLFEDVTAHLYPGQTAQIIGPTGIGKTTLCKIIAGIIPCDHGQVVVSGHAVANLPLESRNRYIHLVAQEPLLMNATLHENLVFGHTSIQAEEYQQVVTGLGLDRIAQTFPEGYNTPVGELGSFLSGGQRQLVRLGRALLQKPSLLIIDEPTTGLDACQGLNSLYFIRKFLPKTIMIFTTHQPITNLHIDCTISLERVSKMTLRRQK
jgi:ABC-type bacteriocin/lantibiotic exporter with double-glycine peptidase domain